VSLTQFLRGSRIEWHGVRLGEPDWGEHSHSIGVGLREMDGPARALLFVNAWKEPLTFELPPVARGWRPIVDTFLPPPDDIRTWEESRPVLGPGYRAGPHSLVFLAADGPERA
jgi:glycogen operon protein